MRDLELSIPKDEATMRLAHPVRCAVCISDEEAQVWREFLGPTTWQALHRAFQTQEGLTGDILASLVDKPEHRNLAVMTNTMAQAPGNTEMGSAYSVMVFVRQQASPQPHYLIEDDLVQTLDHSDISDEVPVSVLTLPAPRFYLEFGRARNLPQKVANPLTGLHTLEGAYIETGTSALKGKGLFVMFTGSPLGNRDAMDDATASVFIPLDEPDMPLKAALLKAREASGQLARQMGLTPAPEEYVEYELEALKLLVKALLFLNLPQATKTLKRDLSLALAQAATKKNPAKRAKALRESRRLADCIVVGAAPEVTRIAREDGRTVRMHWRRGHYRMQRHGPGNALQKLIFLQPMLIGANEARPEPA